MTATTPAFGIRARLHRLARRSVVAAIALGIVALPAPSAVSAATATPDPDEGAIELFVSAGANGVVAPGAPASATVTIENDTDSRLSAGRMLVELNSTPLTDHAAVTTWLDDGEATGGFTELGADATTTVDAGDRRSASIALTADVLDALAPGVYPVRASLSDATTGEGADLQRQSASAGSVLVITSSPLTAPVAAIVPITATPAGGALLTSDELAALTAPDGTLTAQLDGVSGTGAILAVDPAIPAAIRVLGTSAPAPALEWLARLEGLPNERFALQFGDADAATQAQAQLPALLGPESLRSYLDPADFPDAPDAPDATDAPTPTPTPTATPGDAPVLPDDETLTAIRGAATGVLWPRDDVTAADLDAFAGYLGAGVTTVVRSTVVAPAAAAHALAGEHDVLVVSAALSDALSAVADARDAAARASALATASAHLLLASSATAGGPLLVGLDRDENRTAAALRDAIAAVDGAPVGLATLRASESAPTQLVSEADPARASALGELLGDERRLADFATVLSDPAVLLTPERIRVLRTIAVGVRDSAFADEVAEHRAVTIKTLDAVGITPSSTIQLLSANADLPFGIRNDLPWPVTVDLSVASTDLRLDVQQVTPAVIPANTSTRVKVPVSARVGSGEVDLRLSLASRAGVSIGDSQTVRVAVRAEWETIGLTIFGGLAVLLIAVGVVRTVRRKRREAAAHETDAEDTTPTEETDA